MLVSELFESVAPLKLRRDNPGGEWLEGKREQSIEAGLNQYSAPSRFGTITGYWTRRALLPVKLLASLEGINGEHYRTRHDSLNWLNDYMGKNHKLPPFRDEETDKQYFPFIMVYQNGTPYINEGNHRIKAAKELGWEYMPVEIRYFNGGEDEAGPLAPPKVIAHDQKALELGFHPEDFKAK